MRNGVLALLCACGCNGLFEGNPSFTESDGGSTSDARPSGSTEATGSASTEASTEATTLSGDSSTGTLTSSTQGEDTTPLECGEDIYEDNDTRGSASTGWLLADGPFVLEAQLEDTADEDWFKVLLEPAGALRPEPSLSVVAELDSAVCIFVLCTTGETVVNCGQFEEVGGSNDGDPPGCCATNDVTLAYDCDKGEGLDGSAFARIQAPAPIEACLPYVATIDDAS